MPRPYTKAKKAEYLKKYKNMYLTMGYGSFEEAMQQPMGGEDLSEEEYNRLVQRAELIENTVQKLLDDKYNYFEGTAVGNTNFYRIVRAMFRPEINLENVQYNEMIAAKLRTPKGCVEIVQDAIAALGRLTPEVVEAAQKDENVYLEHFNAINVGFVAVNFKEVIDCFTNLGDFQDAFPEEIIQFLAQNKLFFEDQKAFEGEAKTVANESNWIFPKNATKEQIAMGISALPKAERVSALRLSGARHAAEKEGGVYHQPSKECISYFRKIEKRMEKERKSYELATIWLDKRTEKSEVLKLAKGICGITAPKSEKNAGLVESRKGSVIGQAKANFGKSFRDAADEIEKVLERGSIVRHHNKYYQKMLDSIKAIKEFSARGEIGTLSKEDREKLVGELQKLDDASEEYLTEKYQDTEIFSDRALKRIDAARLASAFVRGRLMEVATEKNKEIKVSFHGDTYVDQTDISAELNKYRDRFKTEKKFDSFAKEQAYLGLALETMDGRKLVKGNVETHIEKRVNAMKRIYDRSESFRNAVATGDSDTAVRALRKALADEKKLVDNAKKAADVQKNADKEKQVEGGQKEAIEKTGVQNLMM